MAELKPGIEAAQATAASGDHAAALAQWEALSRAHPASPIVARGRLTALIALDRGPEAARFLEAFAAARPERAESLWGIARRKMPGSLRLALGHCRSGEALLALPEAATRWWEMRKKFSRAAAAHVAYIEFLLRHGRATEAVRAASRAIDVLGTKPELEALLATATAAAPAAAPPGPPTLDPATLPPERLAELRQFLMRFESLGRNCEFGLLQRLFGAEPLSLLRFSTTKVPTLLNLLRSRFEGVGDPAHHTLDIATGEYRLRHLPSGWRTHTTIRADQAEAATVLIDQCRHAKFLRGKLLRDLDGGQKVFVFQMAELTDEQALAIHDALAAYGPNTLLCVRVARLGHAPGDVTWLRQGPREGLMIAHIDHEGQDFAGAKWDVSVAYWLAFCEQAEAHWSAGRTQSLVA